MLTWKVFFISITLILINIIYSAINIFLPTLFDTNPFNVSSAFILLSCNLFFLILISFIFFSQRRNVQTELKKDQHQVVLPPSQFIQQKKNAIYTDVTLIDNIPNLFCIKDPHGKWIQASPEYLSTLRIQFVDYIGKTDEELSASSDNKFAPIFKENIIQDRSAWQSRHAVKKNISLILENGDTIVLEILTTPIFDDQNRPIRLLITGQTIRSIQKEKNKNDLLTSVFSTSHLSFLILNNELKITSINDAFSSLLGYPENATKNEFISCIIGPKRKDDFCAEINNYFKENDFQLWSENIECKKQNDSLIITKLEIKPILSKNDTYDNFFVTIEDVTLSVKNEMRLAQIALYDHLTGLVNRMMFLDRMNKYLSAAKRHKLHAVTFFIDLDKFKIVNDTLGHDAGDEVIKETAKRLLSVTRKEDVVARFSGDEFAILLLNEKTHEKAIFSASLIAKKIISCLDKAFYIQRREVFVGASVGISIYPEDGDTSETLLKNADFAMYEAKSQGRNNYQFYKKEYGLATQGRLELEQNLRKAIAENELQLFYQPQYNTRTREISGAEVLIRWLKKESSIRGSYTKGTMIPPDQFIPIAEETGLIISIGEWILETACRQFKEWLNQGYALPQVSVNVSARQFMDMNFMQSVESALEKAELNPVYLELEITESMLIGDLDKIELQLNRLKKMGIKIALDDFGTGYSSLSYLKKFPIDILKIDQSFIREMTFGSKDASIATAIIEMGHSLNQKIVAEGVENETQLMLLTQQKCDYIQGYYFSKPLPAYKMTDLLQKESVTE